MRPLSHHIKLFTIESVPSIRLNRELSIADEREKRIVKATRKPSSTKGKKSKKVTLNLKSQAAMDTLDPATRALLEGML